MQRALQTIGFSVRKHLARVWMHDGLEGPAPPATHATLTAEVGDRTWLIDVGFGSITPDRPLVWQMNTPQQTAYGTFRLTRTRDGHLLESRHTSRWKPVYEILDFHWQDVDFTLANHYTATHPDSPFAHGLKLALTERESRITLSGNRLKRIAHDGSREERKLDAAQLADVLATQFGLPVESDWMPLLQRVARKPGTRTA